jgi:hypothetical protein
MFCVTCFSPNIEVLDRTFTTVDFLNLIPVSHALIARKNSSKTTTHTSDLTVNWEFLMGPWKNISKFASFIGGQIQIFKHVNEPMSDGNVPANWLECECINDVLVNDPMNGDFPHSLQKKLDFVRHPTEEGKPALEISIDKGVVCVSSLNQVGK